MASDIDSDISSQVGLIPEIDNDIYTLLAQLEDYLAKSVSSGNISDESFGLFAQSEDCFATSVSSGNSFDESFGLSQYSNIATNDQSHLLNDFSFVNLPIFPPTFNDSVGNQPL